MSRGSFAFFVLFFFFLAPSTSLFLLLLSACLLPNEALRIKCLKDCRHFTRVGAVVQRYATVHSSLKCSSDYCQTCEEHFEAETEGWGGEEKSFNPALLCKRNKSLVNCGFAGVGRVTEIRRCTNGCETCF